MDKNVDNDKLY